MKIIEQGRMNDPIIQIDEQDIHDLFCIARECLLREFRATDEQRDVLADQMGCVAGFKVVSSRPDEFDEVAASRWEGRMNRLWKLLATYDCEIHDDAEYTC